MQSPAQKAALPAITLAALGVVFGDIGTSPLYALRQCFLTAHLAISEASVLGILSLIFWCMMLTISFKYVTIIMRADNNGEGGIMSLLALNLRTTRISDKKKIYLIALGFIGASLFFGDGIITPAISVLSAIEGLSIATPVFNQWLEPLSIGILTGLFLVQRHGLLGAARQIAKTVKTFGRPFGGFASHPMFSAAPIACGPYAVRVRLVPHASNGAPVRQVQHDWDAEFSGRLRQQDLQWDLQLQPFVDEATTPIEDASVDWPTPYTTVARLTLPRQDPAADAALAAEVEAAVFDPWQALAAHRPLGDVMRARKVVYFESQKGRGAA